MEYISFSDELSAKIPCSWLCSFSNRAAQQLRQAGHNIVCWLVGGLDADNPASVSAQQLQKWIDSKVVEYQGFATEVRPWIAQADAIVCPSYREGVPRVLLEAASMAKPLIATDVAGCRDVVESGKNGFLVPPKNASELGKAMLKLTQLSEKQWAKMGAYGRKKVCETFDETFIADIFYDQVQVTLRSEAVVPAWASSSDYSLKTRRRAQELERISR